MARLNTLLFFAVIALSVVALFDLYRTDRAKLRNFPRGAWAVLIVFCPVAGAVAWFRGGRVETAATAAPRPIGPDDDPDFLRSLAESLRNR